MAVISRPVQAALFFFLAQLVWVQCKDEDDDEATHEGDDNAEDDGHPARRRGLRPTVGTEVTVLETSSVLGNLGKAFVGKKLKITHDAKDYKPYKIEGSDEDLYEHDVKMEGEIVDDEGDENPPGSEAGEDIQEGDEEGGMGGEFDEEKDKFLDGLFEQFDADKDTMLSRDELKNAFQEGKGGTDAKKEEAFKHADVNRNHKIDNDEIAMYVDFLEDDANDPKKGEEGKEEKEEGEEKEEKEEL